MNGKKREMLETFNFRFACKEFDKEKKIPEDDFKYILETGRLSPSSFGWEPWEFVVVQNMDIRNKLKQFAWGAEKKLETASHFVLIMVRKPSEVKPDSEYIEYMAKDIQKLPEDVVKMKLDFFKNFQQFDFGLTDDRKIADWATRQVYIPLANMMTAAAYIGIDSCPIEGFNKEKIQNILEEEKITDTDKFSIAVMVAFGYRLPNSNKLPKTRRPFDEIVKWIN